jgi:hypothetical protein
MVREASLKVVAVAVGGRRGQNEKGEERERETVAAYRRVKWMRSMARVNLDTNASTCAFQTQT